MLSSFAFCAGAALPDRTLDDDDAVLVSAAGDDDATEGLGRGIIRLTLGSASPSQPIPSGSAAGRYQAAAHRARSTDPEGLDFNPNPSEEPVVDPASSPVRLMLHQAPSRVSDDRSSLSTQ